MRNSTGNWQPSRKLKAAIALSVVSSELRVGLIFQQENARPEGELPQTNLLETEKYNKKMGKAYFCQTENSVAE